MSSFMIYGANGYTTSLIASEAVRRGMRPILAGRSAEKLAMGGAFREASDLCARDHRRFERIAQLIDQIGEGGLRVGFEPMRFTQELGDRVQLRSHRSGAGGVGRLFGHERSLPARCFPSL